MATSKRKQQTSLSRTPWPDPPLMVAIRKIVRRVYGRYQQRGCVDGHDLDDWFAAECELESARNAPSD